MNESEFMLSRIVKAARMKADRQYSDSADTVLKMIEDAGFPLNDENARIVYAILKLSGSDSNKLCDAIAAKSDWRDVLVAAKLANENWEQKIFRDMPEESWNG